MLPKSGVTCEDDSLVTAPQVPNLRHKIIWSEECIEDYQVLVSHQLKKLREDWFIPGSDSSVSILLNLTNVILSMAATETNKSVSLAKPHRLKSVKSSQEVKEAHRILKKAHVKFKSSATSHDKNLAYAILVQAKKSYRFLVRQLNHKEASHRDSQLFSLYSGNASDLYRKIRSSKLSSHCSVPYLQVGDKKYPGTRVGDGMFDSISNLKKLDQVALSSTPCYDSWSEDYQYILQLCKDKRDIPEISYEDSTSILHSMKSSVSDFWSITPSHYTNAGVHGLCHFNFLLNRVIMDINTSSVKELNTAYALLLHKGHNKPKTSDRSYRTISTCPVIAKGLDIYIHKLFRDLWNKAQAETQYQGEGRNHDLAALLITEAVQQSLHFHHQPIFLLFLDARSAFDRVVISFLMRSFYLNGMTGQSIIYLNNRHSNRITFLEWDKLLMGPIADEQGLEQGGCTSSEGYKMYNNDLLKLLQKSSQGVDLGNGLTVSGIGQADDIALVSNNIFNLFHLLYLALIYSQKYHIELCPDKTKLLMMKNHLDNKIVAFNPITINGKQISFSQQAEHVGIIRSVEGNIPNLMNRLSSHRKALAAKLGTGIAKSHRGNLAAALKIEKLYAMPVLFSGLPSLVLTQA